MFCLTGDATSQEIKGLAFMLFCFCLVGGLGSSIWHATHEDFTEEVYESPELSALTTMAVLQIESLA